MRTLDKPYSDRKRIKFIYVIKSFNGKFAVWEMESDTAGKVIAEYWIKGKAKDHGEAIAKPLNVPVKIKRYGKLIEYTIGESKNV